MGSRVPTNVIAPPIIGPAGGGAIPTRAPIATRASPPVRRLGFYVTFTEATKAPPPAEAAPA